MSCVLKSALVGLCLLIAGCRNRRVAPANDLWSAARAAYVKGDYKSAINLLEKIDEHYAHESFINDALSLLSLSYLEVGKNRRFGKVRNLMDAIKVADFVICSDSSYAAENGVYMTKIRAYFATIRWRFDLSDQIAKETIDAIDEFKEAATPQQFAKYSAEISRIRNMCIAYITQKRINSAVSLAYDDARPVAALSSLNSILAGRDYTQPMPEVWYRKMEIRKMMNASHDELLDLLKDMYMHYSKYPMQGRKWLSKGVKMIDVDGTNSELRIIKAAAGRDE